jgi:hypothetical protein
VILFHKHKKKVKPIDLSGEFDFIIEIQANDQKDKNQDNIFILTYLFLSLIERKLGKRQSVKIVTKIRVDF